jgi:hypothetical protein
VPLGIFIFRYAFFSPFNKTPEGITVMLTKVAMFLILGFGALGLFYPDYIGRPWIRLVLYASLLLFFTVDLILLWRIQHKYPFKWHRKRK